MENIKLEAGKYYRTAKGDKAFITGASPFDSNLTSGFIEGNFDCARTWRPSGKCVDGGAGWNIVAEWVEPKRIKGWLAIAAEYADAPICETRDEAIRRFGGEPAACIEIDVLEGQGLDGSTS